MAQPVLAFAIKIDGIDYIIKATDETKKFKVEAVGAGKETELAFKDMSKEMQKSLQAAGKSLVDLNKATDDSNKSSKALKGSTAILSKGFEDATRGINIFGIGLDKIGKISGIGILITAVVKLIEYISKLKPVTDFLEEAFATIDGIIKGLGNSLTEIGEIAKSTFKLLLDIATLNFKGAAEDVANIGANWDKAGDNINKAIKQSEDMLQVTRDLKKATDDLALSQAKIGNEIARQQAIADDANKPYAKRIEAIKEINKLEKERLANEQNVAELEIKNLGDTNKLFGEKLTKYKELLAQIETIKGSREAADRAESTGLTNLNKEAKEKADARADIVKASEDRIRAIRDKSLLDSIKDAQDKEAVALEQSQEARLKALDKEVEAAKKAKTYKGEVEKQFKEERIALEESFSTEVVALNEKQTKDKIQYEASLNAQILALRRSTQDETLEDEKQQELAAATTSEAKLAIENNYSVKVLEIKNQRALDDLDIQIQAVKDSDDLEEDKLKKIQELEDRKVAIIKNGATAVTTLRKKNADTEKKIAADSEKAKIDLIAQNLGAAAEIFGKQTVAYKALKVAETTLSTYSSATKAYEDGLSLGAPIGPIVAPIFAGIAVASGLANVAKIIATPVPDKGSLPAPPSVNAPAPAASTYGLGGVQNGPSHADGGINANIEGGEAIINKQSTQMFRGVLSLINQAGGGVDFGSPSRSEIDGSTLAEAPVIKVYTVASEMSSQQEANLKIERLARL